MRPIRVRAFSASFVVLASTYAAVALLDALRLHGYLISNLTEGLDWRA